MAEKLERKVMEIYGENAATRDIIAYGSDIAGNIVETKDPDVIQTEAYKTGVRSAVVGNNSTTLQNRQALDFLFSRQLKYLYQHGIAEWGADETYFVNSLAVGSNGNLYVSLTDNNKGNDPVTDTTNWQAFPTPAQLAQKVAKAGDTMTGNLNLNAGLIFGNYRDTAARIQLPGVVEGKSYQIVNNASESEGYLQIYDDESKGLVLIKSAGSQPHYFDGATPHRLLTTQDEINGNVVGYFSTSAPVAITLPYTAPANGWIRVFSQRTLQSGFNITLDDQDLFYKGSYGGQNDDTSSFIFPIKKGQVFNCNVALSNIYFFPNVL